MKYNEDGEKQVSEYLDRFGLHVGYMLSFSYIKNKTPEVTLVHVEDKILYEGIV